jgi:hypothetical protein
MQIQLDQLPLDVQKWFCEATKNPPVVVVWYGKATRYAGAYAALAVLGFLASAAMAVSFAVFPSQGQEGPFLIGGASAGLMIWAILGLVRERREAPYHLGSYLLPGTFIRASANGLTVVPT